MTLTKPALLLLTLLLTACGGGGGGGGSSSASGSTGGVSGSGTTGIIQNAIVTAYKLTNGEKDGVLATTQTDDLGLYTLSFDTDAGMILIEIVGDNDTTIICDNATGCSYKGNVYSFGESYAVDSDFILQAVAYYDGNKIDDLHLNPVTDIVAKITVDSIKNGDTGTDNELLTQANEQVANAFGLPSTTTLTTLKPIDITTEHNDEVDDTQLKMSLIISAFEDRETTIGSTTATIANRIRGSQTVTTEVDRIRTKSVNTAKRFKRINANNNTIRNKVTVVSDDLKDDIAATTNTFSFALPTNTFTTPAL